MTPDRPKGHDPHGNLRSGTPSRPGEAAQPEAGNGRRARSKGSQRGERERLQGILDVMPDGVCLCNPDYQIEYINPALARTFGPVNGRKCFDYFYGRNTVCPWCEMPSVLAGKVVRCESYYPKVGRSYEVVEKRVDRPEGGFAKLKVFRDVTHRKKADEALRRSEERYALAERAAGIGSWDWDIPTGRLHWSAAIEPMFGLAQGEFDGTYEAFLDRVHPEDRAYVAAEVAACVEKGTEYDIEHRIVRPDGTVRWVSETGDVIRDDEGKAVRMVGIVQDITDRKAAQNVVRNERALLEAALQQMPAAVLVIAAPSGRVLLANEKAGELLNVSPGDTTGWRQRTGPRAFRPDGRPYARRSQPLARALRDGETVEKEEMLLQRPDGSLRTLLVNAAPVCDREGEPRAAVATYYDISERKQMEDGLRQAREELQERVAERTAELTRAQDRLRDLAAELALAEDRERRRIAADLHDHVSQTLALGNIKLGALQQFVSNPEADGAFEQIRGHLKEAIEYSRSLMFDLSPPVLYEMGLEPALQALTEKIARRHGLAIDFETEGTCAALSDDVRVVLFQSTRELLLNVARHAAARRAVVSVQWRGQAVRVSVADDGAGFDVSEVEPRSHQENGFGLLNIRERLGRLGGSLELWSEPTKGTRAALVVPVRKQHRQA